MLLFDLPMRGSWLVLIGSVSLFLVGALGFGLLISTIAETQQVAFQMALLTSLLPTLMLSGFIFPIASMPTALQAVTYIVPARYFLVALRGDRPEGRRARAMFWQDLAGAGRLRRRSFSAWRRSGCAGSGRDAMSRLLHIMRKEFLELRQDPRLFGIVIIAPIVQLTLLGYAATTDVRNVPMVVVDQDRSAASRELISRFDASQNFAVVDVADVDRRASTTISTAAARGWR